MLIAPSLSLNFTVTRLSHVRFCSCLICFPLPQKMTRGGMWALPLANTLPFVETGRTSCAPNFIGDVCCIILQNERERCLVHVSQMGKFVGSSLSYSNFEWKFSMGFHKSAGASWLVFVLRLSDITFLLQKCWNHLLECLVACFIWMEFLRKLTSTTLHFFPLF